MPITVRAYDEQADAEAAYALWEAALGAVWPLTPARLHQVLVGYANYRTGNHFVAEQNGRIVGLIAVQAKQPVRDAPLRASIPLLIVAPEEQRRGIGTLLHETALDTIRRAGIGSVQLGAGGPSYFWPGVPNNLPGAVAFFEASGWQFTETAYDLVGSLRDYATPPEIKQRLERERIDIRLPALDPLLSILRFEEREFPNWLEAFRTKALLGPAEGRSDMLAAWNAEGEVVGTLLLSTFHAGDSDTGLTWHRLLGDDMGVLGAVGVAENARERGIGTGLVAYASKILKARGVNHCHVGWIWLLDFYGRLGYRPWREYATAWREL